MRIVPPQGGIDEAFSDSVDLVALTRPDHASVPPQEAQILSWVRAGWSEQWKASYIQLSADRQAACDEAAIELIKQTSSPGLRIKPIQPEKYYLEARINSGDRIVFRVEEGTIFFVDVVHHDDISR